MTTNALMELAERWERLADQHGTRTFTGNDHRLFANELRAALRTAAAEGGEAVAYLHYVAGDDGEPDQALSFTADSFPLEGVAGYRKVSCQPLYAHPITFPNEVGDAVAWVDANDLRRFVNGTGGPFLHAGVENALRSVPLYTHPSPEVARDAGTPAEQSLALQMLVAAGHVTQGKVDEALSIAHSLHPTDSGAGRDGMVIVPKEVRELYDFMVMAFAPFTSQQEQIAISLKKAKAAMKDAIAGAAGELDRG